MTDHKFTDDEIIKALECCRTVDGNDCSTCPYRNKIYVLGLGGCVNDLVTDALALINRQKAEIERLYIALEENQKATKYWKDIAHRETGYVKAARAEAIKEFAERLRKITTSLHPCSDELRIFDSDIDELVKEMTEGKK